ncbi:methyl-accepting chemotaxis protein [Alkalimarinus alittae]|uniref:Methyl-accepting chemotaxis protein n=1 Tax=Alkalimarinus alittae TaxID=2961619 RepID=A0ABY6N261_9ALTE|nr:methyl-accepting chemotaxis protein [Alkalimarinus alittae]UZE96082.1 methyl-accepting chemotaxis protein [Alkalimarinus alittae]
MLKNIFFPGMKLISRLGFANKFMLISLLFFVPLVWLSYTVINDAYRQIEITENQRKGLELLNQTQTLVNAAERYRDAKIVAAYQFSTDLNAGLVDYQKAVTKAISTLEESNAKFTQEATYLKLLQSIKQSFKEMEHVSVTSNNTPFTTFNTLNSLVANSNALLQATVELSQLSIDSNPETKSLVDFAVRDLKPFSETVGRLRSTGSYALTLPYLSSNIAEELDANSVKLYEAQPQLKKIVSIMIPQSQSDLQEMGLTLATDITQLLDLVDNKVMTAVTFDTPWQTYFDAASKFTDLQYTLTSKIFSAVDQRFKVRLDEQHNKLQLTSMAIGAVLLLIMYLYASFYLSLRTSIDRLLDAACKMAEGDMTVTMTVATHDELGHLTEQFNQTTKRMRELIREVHNTSNSVYQQSQEVSQITGVTSSSINQQMAETEQASSAMTEMSSNFGEVSDFSAQAESAAQEASNEANRGREQVQKTLLNINNLAGEIQSSSTVVDQLAKDSANISQVLVQIKGIAEQTNLLALNAAIEAARAGEHGRGFAVVADEVRSLSGRTHESTVEIEEMVDKIQLGVGNAVTAMSNSHKMAEATVIESKAVEDALDAIHDKVSSIAEMNTHIAEAVKQQAATAEDIDRNIVGISRAAEGNVSNAAETTRASEEMASKANQLREMLTSFKI